MRSFSENCILSNLDMLHIRMIRQRSQQKRSIVRSMRDPSKTRMTRLVLWSLAWAIALIASAILFKGNPFKDWIQSALFIGAITFWLWRSRQFARNRC